MNDPRLANQIGIISLIVIFSLFVFAGVTSRNYRVGYTTYVATPDGMVQSMEWDVIVRQYSKPTNTEAYEAAVEDAAERGYAMDSIAVNYCIKR